jgi:hypothetical protein
MAGKQRPSDITVAQSISNVSTFELELFAHHHFAYPELKPIEIADDEANINHLITGLAQPSGERGGRSHQRNRGALQVFPRLCDSFALTQSCRSGMIPYVPPSLKFSRGTKSGSSGSSLSSLSDSSSPHQYDGQGRKPLFLCDDRLSGLRIQFWTEVKISDDLAARVISLYLRTDHPLLALFSPDLFISDLVGWRIGHCSPLLVSALMQWACVRCQNLNFVSVSKPTS